MRWAITHRPQDLPRSKHILAEGQKKPWKELRLCLIDDLIGVTQNLRVVKERYRCLFGVQNQWIYPNLVRQQEKFCNACEDDRVLECEIH